MRALLVCLVVLLLSACARHLTPEESAFLHQIAGPSLDTDRIRIHPGLVALTREAPVPPRVTCQSRLYPPLPGPTAKGAAPAMTLWNLILVRSDWAKPDMTGGYPKTLDLPRASLLAHEATHVWQWQHRGRTGYTPLRAAREHIGNPDPYLFDPDTKAEFSSFGYEQQGAIVEEYLCCRLLAPEAERTRRLHEMLSRVFPVAPLDKPLAQWVKLPWKGVKPQGICD